MLNYFWGKVINGKVKLEYKSEFAKLIKSLEGKQVELTLKRWLRSRTVQQNNYYWLVVRAMAEHTGFIAEEVHELMKRRFLSYEKPYKTKIYKFTKSTTELNIADFTEYVEKVKQFAIDELDIIPPETHEKV